MSTILQALQRAEADRGRGQVPGLHAAPVAPLSPAGGSQHAPSSHPAALRSPWVWLGAGAVLLVGGLLTWVGLLRPPGLAAPPLAAPTPAVAAAGAAPTIDDKNVPLAQYPIASSASDSIAKKPSSPAPLAALPLPEARTGGKTPVARVAAPASEATPTAPTAAPTAIATAAASAPVAAATAAPAVAVVVPLAEATDEVRRLVPTLAISGAVHSNERSQRMVIANGQVLHEGDAWGSEAVVIDEIRPRSVVLKVRGQRVMLPL